MKEKNKQTSSLSSSKQQRDQGGLNSDETSRKSEMLLAPTEQSDTKHWKRSTHTSTKRVK